MVTFDCIRTLKPITLVTFFLLFVLRLCLIGKRTRAIRSKINVYALNTMFIPSKSYVKPSHYRFLLLLIFGVLLSTVGRGQLSTLVIETVEADGSVSDVGVTTTIGDSLWVYLSASDNRLDAWGRIKDWGAFDFDGLNYVYTPDGAVEPIRRFITSNDFVFTDSAVPNDTVFILNDSLVTYYSGEIREQVYVNNRNLVDSVLEMGRLNNGEEYLVSVSHFDYTFYERSVVVHKSCRSMRNGPWFTLKMTYNYDRPLEDVLRSNLALWPIDLSLYMEIQEHFEKRKLFHDEVRELSEPCEESITFKTDFFKKRLSTADSALVKMGNGSMQLALQDLSHVSSPIAYYMNNRSVQLRSAGPGDAWIAMIPRDFLVPDGYNTFRIEYEDCSLEIPIRTALHCTITTEKRNEIVLKYMNVYRPYM